MSNSTAASGHFFAITKSDTTNFQGERVSRGIFVGTGGDVKVLSENDQTITFKNCIAGTILPIRVKRVFSTDTSADDLVCLL